MGPDPTACLGALAVRPCAGSANSEGTGPTTMGGALPADHAPVHGGFSDGYQCQVRMSRVQADGSLVAHSSYMLPMDQQLMADLLQLPRQQFVCLTGISGIAWPKVAQLLSSAVPVSVVLFVIRHNFTWADSLRARSRTPLPGSTMHMPHAVISGRKTVSVQIPGMSYDEIRAGRRNIE